MRAHRVGRDDQPAAGWVLCQELRGAEGKVALARGTVLGPDEIALLPGLAWEELHLVELEVDELYEEEAGRRVAHAVAGRGVKAQDYGGGTCRLLSAWRGILQVDVEALRQVDLVEEVAVSTLLHGQVVDAGEEIARVKIIPFALATRRVAAVEASAAASEGVLRVRPFLPMRVGVVVPEGAGEAGLTRARESLGPRIEWLGSELLPPLAAAPSAEALAGAIQQLLQQGAQLVLATGTHPMDPLDSAIPALRRLDATLERVGVPAHPGSLLWLAHVLEVPVIGVPRCGISSQSTVFDLVLTRVLTGERLTAADLAELGHGGLLRRDVSFYPR